jgi:hypothetical protein
VREREREMREREKTEERGRSSAGAAAAWDFQARARDCEVRVWGLGPLVGRPAGVVLGFFSFFLNSEIHF